MFETIDSIDPTIRSSKLSGELLFHAGVNYYFMLISFGRCSIKTRSCTESE